MNFQWVTYTDGPPVAADFLTTSGHGPTICIDKTTGEAYYLDGITPTRTGIGPSGYQRADHIILSTGAIVGDLGNFYGTTLNSYLQVHSTDDTMTGIQVSKWGNDAKSVQNLYSKSRGSDIGQFAPLQVGDRVFTDSIQGSGTGNQFGHVGVIRWLVDKTPTNAGELGGRWRLQTGTGYHISENPTYYGLRTAIDINCLQQVVLPGPLDTAPTAGTASDAILTIGKGGSAPGEAPIKLTTSGVSLQTTPVPGVIETDGTDLYWTNSSGTRKKVSLV